MAGVWMWVRKDARSRLRSLVLLGVIVAVATGVILAAVAGARRDQTAADRLAARGETAQVWALPNLPPSVMDWNRVRALPYVESVGQFALAYYDVKGYPFGLGYLPPASPELFSTVERGVVVEGRRSDPNRLDQVMITPGAKKLGMRVGMHVTLAGWRADKIREYMASPEPVKSDGPAVDATITGIVKSVFAVGSGDDTGGVLPSWRFYDKYHASLGSVSPVPITNALIHLRDGQQHVDELSRDLDRIAGRPVEIRRAADIVKQAEKATSLESNALLAFALAAALATLVLVGQSIVRLIAASATDLPVLGALGVTTRQRSLALTIGPTIASLVGVVLGGILAFLASGFFPISIGRQLEPSPGLSFNAAIIGLGVVIAAAIAVVGIAGTALWYVRRGDRAARRSRSPVVGALRDSGAPLPAVFGAQLALERGRGRSSMPVMPALIGAVVGVIGIVGALTFRAGLDHAVSDMHVFGQQFHAAASALPTEPLDPKVVKTAVDDPNVVAVNNNTIGVIEVRKGAAKRAVTVFAIDPLKGQVHVVTQSGRAPRAANEITLAPAEAHGLHAHTGDTVTVGTNTPYHVVGIGFTPEDSHTTYSEGAWMTAAGQHLALPKPQDLKYVRYDVEFAKGINASAETDKLTHQTHYGFDPALIPGNVTYLKGVRRVPLALGAFLTLLAIAAVGHALASAVRRRRRDIAVLRTIGFTRQQVRLTVVSQATILALVGILFGVPLGILVGRFVWHSVATSTPLHYVAPLALVIILLIGPAAILVCNGLGALPARRAARLRAAEVLRTE